jgi:thioredoxin family protein
VSPVDGVEAAPSAAVESPETYVGYRQGERFASPGRLGRGVPKTYGVPDRLPLNDWGLVGSWNIGPESALLETAGGRIVYRFHSRDLHLVLAPGKDGRPVRFKVRLDGAAPGDAHGSDVTPDGGGEVREPRLYQLIRQGTRVDDRTFEIEFLDPGVRAFVFTFG